jgi:tetratricopeptide (TPR) repeat protein
MNLKSQYGQTAVLMVSVIVAVGLLCGCYSRDTLPGQKTVYGKLNPDPLSEAELRKFAASVRRVDGEAEAHYQLALHFQQNHRHKLAIDELRQALQRSPAHVQAYNALGVSYDNLGDHEAAVESYLIALKIDPKLDYIYNNLGYAYLLNGQTVEAVIAFQKAVSINAIEKRFRNNLGLAYVKQDRYELAFEQFRALNSSAAAEKTFAKVMQDLGKGSQTERVLLAARSAPAEQAQEDDPAQKMPGLAQPEEPKPGNDPVARYQAVTGSMNQTPRTGAPGSAAQIEPPSDPVVAPVHAPGKSVEPVVRIPALPANEESLYELKVAVTPVPPFVPDFVKYYPIASVALAESNVKAPRTKTIMPSSPVIPIQKEMREIEPAQVEPTRKVESREQQEERILVAASSTRAGGWQNAPEPGRTAEKGLVEVEVANGNGVKGSAGKVAEHLRRSGFNVVRVLDAQSPDHFSTKVFYYGNLAEARQVLSAIPEVSADAELYELESMGSRIRLLIGRDLIERSRNKVAKSSPRF